MVELIQGAGSHGVVRWSSNLDIDRRRFQASVPEKCLNTTDVATILETMRRETMS